MPLHERVKLTSQKKEFLKSELKINRVHVTYVELLQLIFLSPTNGKSNIDVFDDFSDMMSHGISGPELLTELALTCSTKELKHLVITNFSFYNQQHF